MKIPFFDLSRAFHRVLLALILGATFWTPFTGLRVPAAILVVGVVPGMAVAASRRFSRAGALALSTALSPVIFGGVVLAALGLGIHLNGAARAAALVSLFLFAVLARRSSLAGAGRSALVGPAIVIGLAAVMAFGLPLADTWWRVRSDSWFHAAVADKLARGGLPLQDPYFAGLRLHYPYFYHAVLAGLADLAHIDRFHAMIALNAVALVSCGFCFHALSGMFSRRPGPRLAGLCLWLFGMNGWFYLFYPIRLVRAFTGSTHGRAVLEALFPWTPPGHDTAVALVSVAGNQFMFLDKFMVGTAFSLTFSLMAAVLYLLLRGRRGEWSRRHDAGFIVSVFGAVVLHAVTGVTIGSVTLLILAALLVVRAQPSPGGPPYERLAAWVVVAVLPAVPYLRSFAPAADGGHPVLGFAVQPWHLVGLLADVLPALVLAAVFFKGWRESRDGGDTLGARPFAEMSISATGIIVFWALLVLLAAATIDLGTNNETKFAFLLHLPLSVLAVGGLERLWGSASSRRLALLAVLSATLPLHALYFHHAVRDKTGFEETTGERAAYAWIQSHSPADAVFIEEDNIVRIPVLGSRDVYRGGDADARNLRHDAREMVLRGQTRDALFSEEGPGEADMLGLRALRRPVFMIYRMKPGGAIEDAERYLVRPKLTGRFVAQDVTIFEVDLDANPEGN